MGGKQGGEETLPTLFLGSFAAVSKATWEGGFRDRQLKEMCICYNIYMEFPN